ncbi:hypothetical protein BBAD15_g7339 [Beauveria bassiana D1-5]|uniref:Uncharacterized protein n=1 Tax=Beauveria bassiana D1-5 TaxID=1245745 RepID=A0A0A2VLZ0_BEABA|nr:hypothetical protein BBAD15_g7339 [Beauveria bassiana D1-5]
MKLLPTAGPPSISVLCIGGVLEEAIKDLANLLAEHGNRSRVSPANASPDISQESDQAAGPQESSPSNPLFPQELNDDILEEVPWTDPTFTSIDGILMESRSSSGLRLCRFRTFQGAVALQPCISLQRELNLFDALEECEANGHRIYKDARLWACAVQGLSGLPMPCRWLAATIFNFASDMLRPDNTQDFMWTMRAWLLHWYDFATELFRKLEIGLSVPEIDWFQPPTWNGITFLLGEEESHEDSRSSDGTVVHHILSPEATDFIHGSILHPITQSPFLTRDGIHATTETARI